MIEGIIGAHWLSDTDRIQQELSVHQMRRSYY